MSLLNLIPGLVGAFVGVVGTLAVSLILQRRDYLRRAWSSARAVYFELDVNRLSVELALEFGSFAPLGRSSFERLLPELATILDVAELQAITGAYTGHAGYQQMSTERDHPRAVRELALHGLLAAHVQALQVLRQKAFSESERRMLAAAPPATVEITSATTPEAARPR